MVRRETFIALRARRQAHRVASDVLYPRDLLPPASIQLVPPELMAEAQEELDSWAARKERRAIAQRQEDQRLMSSTLIALAVVIAILVIFALAIQ